MAAFDICEEISKARGQLIGHQEIIKAAIRHKDKVLLDCVRGLTRRIGPNQTTKGDLRCDVMVVLLELGEKEVAKVLFWDETLTEERMIKIIDREMNLRNPEVLHQIYVYFHDDMDVSEEFMDSFLFKLADLYNQDRNIRGLQDLRHDIRRKYTGEAILEHYHNIEEKARRLADDMDDEYEEEGWFVGRIGSVRGI